MINEKPLMRVFTDENGAFKPEILKKALFVEIDGFDHDYIMELLDEQKNETLYHYLLIAQCNDLSAGLPEIFEHIGGWTELLFPDRLLQPDSVIGCMIAEIPEEDWRDQVQMIGWMHPQCFRQGSIPTLLLMCVPVQILTLHQIPIHLEQYLH